MTTTMIASPTPSFFIFNKIGDVLTILASPTTHRIELPSDELGIDEGILLRSRADFGSTLDNYVILDASSVIHQEPTKDRSFRKSGPMGCATLITPPWRTTLHINKDQLGSEGCG
ncbi:F-box family protein [Pyrus ussuriensis x Pyrus communis]|uniref:F-box family protein n=1 Tax=Pyrus ussuriensis x Pyrus communis TaxID=2448454 RepID=A0A5N5GBJ3_9ROSA|nr:F-box family protein [Pyrus ussuriensis x Pyrus communis]